MPHGMLAILNSLLLVSALLHWLADAHPGFVGLIPNGAKVPGPRKPMASGHVNPMGHGERNQFGLDFHAAGKKWTKDLCRTDSDGDGKTNGEELGDPECVWKKGKTPVRVTDITHPGLADSAAANAASGDGFWSRLFGRWSFS